MADLISKSKFPVHKQKYRAFRGRALSSRLLSLMILIIPSLPISVKDKACDLCPPGRLALGLGGPKNTLESLQPKTSHTNPFSLNNQKLAEETNSNLYCLLPWVVQRERPGAWLVRNFYPFLLADQIPRFSSLQLSERRDHLW